MTSKYPECLVCKAMFATVWGARNHSAETGHAYQYQGAARVCFPTGYELQIPDHYTQPKLDVEDIIRENVADAPEQPKYRVDCPVAIAQGADEYHCLVCGRTWDKHEDRPRCGEEEL